MRACRITRKMTSWGSARGTRVIFAHSILCRTDVGARERHQDRGNSGRGGCACETAGSLRRPIPVLSGYAGAGRPLPFPSVSNRATWHLASVRLPPVLPGRAACGNVCGHGRLRARDRSRSDPVRWPFAVRQWSARRRHVVRPIRWQQRRNKLRFLFVWAMSGRTFGKRRVLLSKSVLILRRRAATALALSAQLLATSKLRPTLLPLTALRAR